MSTSVTYSNQYLSFQERYDLDSAQCIKEFFVSQKKDPGEFLLVRMRRILHYIQTGTWISEKSILRWAANHPKQQISALFNGRPVQRKVIRYEHKMVVPHDSFVTKCVSAARFFGQFIQHPKTIGAFSPSSKSLAKVIVSKIQKNPAISPRRILEIGPGTGSFTDRIIKRMNPDDKLDLVEFDKELADQLKTRYKGTPNVTVHCCSILDYTVPKNKRYDHIVSGLPLNAFSAKMVEEVFEKYRTLARIGGTISYFEYLFLPTFQRVSLGREKRANLDNILAQKACFFEKYGKGKASVFSNLPPAQVLHHKIER